MQNQRTEAEKRLQAFEKLRSVSPAESPVLDVFALHLEENQRAMCETAYGDKDPNKRLLALMAIVAYNKNNLSKPIHCEKFIRDLPSFENLLQGMADDFVEILMNIFLLIKSPDRDISNAAIDLMNRHFSAEMSLVLLDQAFYLDRPTRKVLFEFLTSAVLRRHADFSERLRNQLTQTMIRLYHLDYKSLDLSKPISELLKALARDPRDTYVSNKPLIVILRILPGFSNFGPAQDSTTILNHVTNPFYSAANGQTLESTTTENWIVSENNNNSPQAFNQKLTESIPYYLRRLIGQDPFKGIESGEVQQSQPPAIIQNHPGSLESIKQKLMDGLISDAVFSDAATHPKLCQILAENDSLKITRAIKQILKRNRWKCYPDLGNHSYMTDDLSDELFVYDDELNPVVHLKIIAAGFRYRALMMVAGSWIDISDGIPLELQSRYSWIFDPRTGTGRIEIKKDKQSVVSAIIPTIEKRAGRRVLKFEIKKGNWKLLEKKGDTETFILSDETDQYFAYVKRKKVDKNKYEYEISFETIKEKDFVPLEKENLAKNDRVYYLHKDKYIELYVAPSIRQLTENSQYVPGTRIQFIIPENSLNSSDAVTSLDGKKSTPSFQKIEQISNSLIPYYLRPSTVLNSEKPEDRQETARDLIRSGDYLAEYLLDMLLIVFNDPLFNARFAEVFSRKHYPSETIVSLKSIRKRKDIHKTIFLEWLAKHLLSQMGKYSPEEQNELYVEIDDQYLSENVDKQVQAAANKCIALLLQSEKLKDNSYRLYEPSIKKLGDVTNIPMSLNEFFEGDPEIHGNPESLGPLNSFRPLQQQKNSEDHRKELAKREAAAEDAIGRNVLELEYFSEIYSRAHKLDHLQAKAANLIKSVKKEDVAKILEIYKFGTDDQKLDILMFIVESAWKFDFSFEQKSRILNHLSDYLDMLDDRSSIHSIAETAYWRIANTQQIYTQQQETIDGQTYRALSKTNLLKDRSWLSPFLGTDPTKGYFYNQLSSSKTGVPFYLRSGENSQITNQKNDLHKDRLKEAEKLVLRGEFQLEYILEIFALAQGWGDKRTEKAAEKVLQRELSMRRFVDLLKSALNGPERLKLRILNSLLTSVLFNHNKTSLDTKNALKDSVFQNYIVRQAEHSLNVVNQAMQLMGVLGDSIKNHGVDYKVTIYMVDLEKDKPYPNFGEDEKGKPDPTILNNTPFYVGDFFGNEINVPGFPNGTAPSFLPITKFQNSPLVPDSDVADEMFEPRNDPIIQIYDDDGSVESLIRQGIVMHAKFNDMSAHHVVCRLLLMSDDATVQDTIEKVMDNYGFRCPEYWDGLSDLLKAQTSRDKLSLLQRVYNEFLREIKNSSKKSGLTPEGEQYVVVVAKTIFAFTKDLDPDVAKFASRLLAEFDTYHNSEGNEIYHDFYRKHKSAILKENPSTTTLSTSLNGSNGSAFKFIGDMLRKGITYFTKTSVLPPPDTQAGTNQQRKDGNSNFPRALSSNIQNPEGQESELLKELHKQIKKEDPNLSKNLTNLFLFLPENKEYLCRAAYEDGNIATQRSARVILEKFNELNRNNPIDCSIFLPEMKHIRDVLDQKISKLNLNSRSRYARFVQDFFKFFNIQTIEDLVSMKKEKVISGITALTRPSDGEFMYFSNKVIQHIEDALKKMDPRLSLGMDLSKKIYNMPRVDKTREYATTSNGKNALTNVQPIHTISQSPTFGNEPIFWNSLKKSAQGWISNISRLWTSNFGENMDEGDDELWLIQFFQNNPVDDDTVLIKNEDLLLLTNQNKLCKIAGNPEHPRQKWAQTIIDSFNRAQKNESSKIHCQPDLKYDAQMLEKTVESVFDSENKLDREIIRAFRAVAIYSLKHLLKWEFLAQKDDEVFFGSPNGSQLVITEQMLNRIRQKLSELNSKYMDMMKIPARILSQSDQSGQYGSQKSGPKIFSGLGSPGLTDFMISEDSSLQIIYNRFTQSPSGSTNSDKLNQQSFGDILKQVWPNIISWSPFNSMNDDFSALAVEELLRNNSYSDSRFLDSSRMSKALCEIAASGSDEFVKFAASVYLEVRGWECVNVAKRVYSKNFWNAYSTLKNALASSDGQEKLSSLQAVMLMDEFTESEYQLLSQVISAIFKKNPELLSKFIDEVEDESPSGDRFGRYLMVFDRFKMSACIAKLLLTIRLELSQYEKSFSSIQTALTVLQVSKDENVGKDAAATNAKIETYKSELMQAREKIKQNGRQNTNVHEEGNSISIENSESKSGPIASVIQFVGDFFRNLIPDGLLSSMGTKFIAVNENLGTEHWVNGSQGKSWSLGGVFDTYISQHGQTQHEQEKEMFEHMIQQINNPLGIHIFNAAFTMNPGTPELLCKRANSKTNTVLRDQAQYLIDAYNRLNPNSKIDCYYYMQKIKNILKKSVKELKFNHGYNKAIQDFFKFHKIYTIGQLVTGWKIFNEPDSENIYLYDLLHQQMVQIDVQWVAEIQHALSQIEKNLYLEKLVTKKTEQPESEPEPVDPKDGIFRGTDMGVMKRPSYVRDATNGYGTTKYQYFYKQRTPNEFYDSLDPTVQVNSSLDPENYYLPYSIINGIDAEIINTIGKNFYKNNSPFVDADNLPRSILGIFWNDLQTTFSSISEFFVGDQGINLTKKPVPHVQEDILQDLNKILDGIAALNGQLADVKYHKYLCDIVTGKVWSSERRKQRALSAIEKLNINCDPEASSSTIFIKGNVSNGVGTFNLNSNGKNYGTIFVRLDGYRYSVTWMAPSGEQGLQRDDRWEADARSGAWMLVLNREGRQVTFYGEAQQPLLAVDNKNSITKDPVNFNIRQHPVKIISKGKLYDLSDGNMQIAKVLVENVNGNFEYKINFKQKNGWMGFEPMKTALGKYDQFEIYKDGSSSLILYQPSVDPRMISSVHDSVRFLFPSLNPLQAIEALTEEKNESLSQKLQNLSSFTLTEAELFTVLSIVENKLLNAKGAAALAEILLQTNNAFTTNLVGVWLSLHAQPNVKAEFIRSAVKFMQKDPKNISLIQKILHTMIVVSESLSTKIAAIDTFITVPPQDPALIRYLILLLGHPENEIRREVELALENIESVGNYQSRQTLHNQDNIQRILEISRIDCGPEVFGQNHGYGYYALRLSRFMKVIH